MTVLQTLPTALSQNSLTRICGGIYLLLIATGIFSLAYVPSALVVWEDSAQTITNIQSSELLFRLSIASGFVCFIAYIMLALFLYRLLAELGESLALLMVVFVLVSVPITFVGFSHLYDVLFLLGDDQTVQAIELERKAEAVMFSLQSFNNANTIGGIFWGLWLLPLGTLVYRSEFLPRTLGVLLMLGCLGYLVDILLRLIFDVKSVPFFISLPGTFGEFGLCLWMLIKGAPSETSDLSGERESV